MDHFIQENQDFPEDTIKTDKLEGGSFIIGTGDIEDISF